MPYATYRFNKIIAAETIRFIVTVAIVVYKGLKLVVYRMLTENIIMGIKTGPKRIAISTGKPDRRQRDNKQTPGNTPSLKPHIHKKGD